MGMGTLLFTYVATVLGGIISGIYITLGIDNYKDEKGVFRKAALRNIDKKMDRILRYMAICIFIYNIHKYMLILQFLLFPFALIILFEFKFPFKCINVKYMR